jgi:hypothetical protein
MAYIKTEMPSTLAKNSEYYKYIFKKTEKIICAVFYILENQRHKDRDYTIIKDVEQSALRTMDAALKSLREDIGAAIGSVTVLRYALLELESKLRILAAARGLSEAQLNVFVQEIDAAGRTLEHYLNFNQNQNPFFDALNEDTAAPVRKVGGQKEGAEGVPREVRATSGTQAPTADRRTRIIEVLRSVKEASIKDISEVIKDCSEKTIQRELNALINDNVVSRKGQRRWSKYILVS